MPTPDPQPLPKQGQYLNRTVRVSLEPGDGYPLIGTIIQDNVEDKLITRIKMFPGGTILTNGQFHAYDTGDRNSSFNGFSG